MSKLQIITINIRANDIKEMYTITPLLWFKQNNNSVLPSAYSYTAEISFVV